MTRICLPTRRRTIVISLIAALTTPLIGLIAWAQSGLSEPVYRVAANDTTATQTAPAQVAAIPVAAAATATPLDFAKQGEEHPLMPVIRGLKTSQEILDKDIRDYSCTFVKRERVDGELGEWQHIFMKVMHQPFSVYMSFMKPFAGREVVYVDGQNEGKIIALDVGVKRYLGKIPLDPNGALAMKGQKHPITSVGIRNLTAKLLKIYESEIKFAECEVTTNGDSAINGRKTTLVQIVHPVARKDFRAHVSRIFFDNELKIPIHYDVYLWPAEEGGKPPLDESYTYQNLKVNNSFTARDFDAYNNPEIFKQ